MMGISSRYVVRCERREMGKMAVDVEKTRGYYAHLEEGELCGCRYCQNYREKVKGAYPQVAAFLQGWGVDIEKPLETGPLEEDAQGGVAYAFAQYVVYGRQEGMEKRRIGTVDVGIAEYYPSTGIEAAHFVIEIGPIFLR